jgi:hypothetical protein
VARICPVTAAGAAGEHLGRAGGAAYDRRDLVEGHGEHVVQHERDPLGGCQGVQHHQQRQADPLGQQRLLLRVHGAVLGTDDRVGEAGVQGLLTPGLA